MSKLVRINEITPEELNILQDIDRNCMAMHLPCPPKTFINMKVHEKGELTLDYDFRSKSWVRNAHNMLLIVFSGFISSGPATYGAGSTQCKEVGGSMNTLAYSYLPRTYNSTLGNSDCGIVLGSGNAAETFEEYALQTKIVHGTTSGKLSYAAQSSPVVSYDSGTKTWTVTFTRIFNNNSGGTVTIRETAMYYDTKAGWIFMLCRDLLSSSVEVADTAQLTVTYTMTYTFPT